VYVCLRSSLLSPVSHLVSLLISLICLSHFLPSYSPLTYLTNPTPTVAEKTFLSLRHLASTSSGDISYIAISHSDQASTDAWLSAIGGAGNVEVIIDTDRALYAAWGLGPSSLWHVLNPAALLTVRRMGKDDGINVRPTQSGSRWQTAGSFAVNGPGKVVWGKKAERADEMPDLEEGRKAVA
jgi:AhpC/TSA antioxidant enzyme